MKNNYSEMARQLISACESAKATNAAWLAERGLTIEAARRLPLAQQLELQEAYGRAQFLKRFPQFATRLETTKG